MMRKILLLLVVMALTLVPGVTAFDYFIGYGPYSTDDYGPYEDGWHGPVYDASPQYPLTDYEIDIDIDFSGNSDYFNRVGKVLITGYSGDNEIWCISVYDIESGARRLYIACSVGDRQMGTYGPIHGDWSGPLKFVHSTPDNWEFWVNGNLAWSLTEPDIGPLTTITVGLLHYGSNRIIPGMSCDRIAIYGIADVLTMPVDLAGAITNTTEVVQMVVDTAITMTDLLMTPPIVFVVGISVASACFYMVRSFFRRRIR